MCKHLYVLVASIVELTGTPLYPENLEVRALQYLFYFTWREISIDVDKSVDV
jgi:hypothetical protein